jgi:hypothetical protein
MQLMILHVHPASEPDGPLRDGDRTNFSSRLEDVLVASVGGAIDI